MRSASPVDRTRARCAASDGNGSCGPPTHSAPRARGLRTLSHVVARGPHSAATLRSRGGSTATLHPRGPRGWVGGPRRQCKGPAVLRCSCGHLASRQGSPSPPPKLTSSATWVGSSASTPPPRRSTDCSSPPAAVRASSSSPPRGAGPALSAEGGASAAGAAAAGRDRSQPRLPPAEGEEEGGAGRRPGRGGRHWRERAARAVRRPAPGTRAAWEGRCACVCVCVWCVWCGRAQVGAIASCEAGEKRRTESRCVPTQSRAKNNTTLALVLSFRHINVVTRSYHYTHKQNSSLAASPPPPAGHPLHHPPPPRRARPRPRPRRPATPGPPPCA